MKGGFKMEQKLKTLLDGLLTIETKGNSTLTMANCIRYVERLMAEERTKVTNINENVDE